MKIYNRLFLAFYSLFLSLISLILIILPFDIDRLVNIEGVKYFVESMRGNYIYSLVGLILLFISLRFLLSGLMDKDNGKNFGSYLVMKTELGEILIYEETIIGLIQNVSNKFVGIKLTKTNIGFNEGYINVIIRGEVNQEINIPETSKEIQGLIKEHIEDTTGAVVSDIKVEITNVLSSVPRVK